MRKFFLILILLLSGSFASADDFGLDDNTIPLEEFEKPEADFKSYSVLEFGFSYRTDAQEYYSKDLGAKAKLLTYLTPALAAKIGVGYYPGFKEDLNFVYNSDNIKEYQLELGFRISAYELELLPYLELSYEYHHYHSSGDMPSETKAGIGLAVGMEHYITKEIILGFTVQHVFNHTDLTDYIVTETPPWPGDYYGPYTRYLPSSVYNPTTLSLMVGFRL